VTTYSLYGVRDLYPSGNSGTAERSNIMPRAYVTDHPKEDTFCGGTEGTQRYDCEPYTAWRLKSASPDDPSDSGLYPKDFGPRYGEDEMGYVIDFVGPRMQGWLAMAQGNKLVTKGNRVTNIIVPTKLTLDDPCSSASEGGLVEINPETGGWVASPSYKEIEHKSNIYNYPGSRGDEINRDTKEVVTALTIEVSVTDPKTGRIIMMSVPLRSRANEQGTDLGKNVGAYDCNGKGDGRQSLLIPGAETPQNPDPKCGGRSGRQSWRQLR